MSSDGQEKPARPKISLPSFREVQAAQKPTAPNLFQSRSPQALAQAAPSNAPAASIPQAPAANEFTAPRSQPARPPGVQPGQAATAQPARLQPSMPAMPSTAYNVVPGPSSRAPAPQASTSYSAYPTAGGLVEYQAHNLSTNAILVSRRQEGNPLLKHIRNVRWSYGDIVPDYIMGADCCALFLSMRFHLLKPEYIHHRIKELQRSFRLRVLMCHVDVDDVIEPLQQITRAALLNDVTLICGWSPEECARYLETYKVYETKPADAILGRTDEDYLSRLNAALTTMRGVNRTDVLTLGSAFNTAAGIMQASMEELSACPGIGPTKVRRIFDTFHEPFRKTLQPQPVAGSTQSQQQAGSSGQGAGTAATSPAVTQALPMENLRADDDSEVDEAYMT